VPFTPSEDSVAKSIPWHGALAADWTKDAHEEIHQKMMPAQRQVERKPRTCLRYKAKIQIKEEKNNSTYEM
jgi:hypothetical protein